MSRRQYKTMVEEVEKAESIRSEEVEKLLSLAEDLYEKTKQRNKQIFKLRVVSCACLASFVVGATFLLAWSYRLDFITQALGMIVSSIFLYPFFVSEYYARRERRLLRTDWRAFEDSVSLLSETASTIAEKEGWSSLQKAYFRIRLSRLPIGEKS